MPAFDRQSEYFKGGGFAGAEAYAIHRKNADRMGEYDPRVAKRVLLGKDLSAADYVELRLLRAAFQREVEAALAPFDAFLLPDHALRRAADRRGERERRVLFPLEHPHPAHRRAGQLPRRLRGCRCPARRKAAAPVGLMVCGPAMSDRRILAVAAAIERALARD